MKASFARVLLAVTAIVKLFGIDIPEDTVNTIADGLAALIILYAAWKNNSFTKEAIQADAYLKELKQK